MGGGLGPQASADGGRPCRSRSTGAIAAVGWLLRGNGIILVGAALIAGVGRRASGVGRRAVAVAACLLGADLIYGPASAWLALASGPRDPNTYRTEFAAGFGAAATRVADVKWVRPARLTASAGVPAAGVIIMASVVARAVPFAAVRDRTEAGAVVIAPVPELIYLNAGRQSVPTVEDAAGLRGDAVTRPPLAGRLRLAPGRPVYVYGPAPATDAGGAPNRTRQLLDALPFPVDPVYRDADGAHWLARARRPATPPPR